MHKHKDTIAGHADYLDIIAGDWYLNAVFLVFRIQNGERIEWNDLHCQRLGAIVQLFLSEMERHIDAGSAGVSNSRRGSERTYIHSFNMPLNCSFQEYYCALK